ncbi:MAG: hypothetical protein LBG60_04920 [Bifidobacteriaceae bacterium]|nr:hypothetical protein [Bifidobacteriaceae bacterium]
MSGDANRAKSAPRAGRWLPADGFVCDARPARPRLSVCHLTAAAKLTAMGDASRGALVSCVFCKSSFMLDEDYVCRDCHVLFAGACEEGLGGR